MQRLNSFENIQLKSSWVTIGSFDGVHRGHQALINDMVSDAHGHGGSAVVVTFHPHPAVVLRSIQSPFYLTSPEEKSDLFAQEGIDYTITLRFDRQLAALTAFDFVKQLSDHLGMRQLWVGNDFALGRDRQGNVPALIEIGKQLGYTVHSISPVSLGGNIISSSRIRQRLSEGNVAEVAQLLGRWYSLSGPVIHGDGRGKNLGIPTANLEIPKERLLPAFGIYATWTWLGDKRLPSVTNIGIRPTFENKSGQPQIESHLLDFDKDLYGQSICLEFVEYLRPEARFDSIQALIEQMQKDIQRSREVLQDAARAPGLPA
jgi:riboflavin kinase/FMN adenylyltransferase